jgi:PadR family transcriptional regulator, regulatory protein PadR
MCDRAKIGQAGDLWEKRLDNNTVCRIVCDVHYMTPGTNNHDLFENLRLELRRGSLVLAVLAALREEQYGYTLRKTLGEQGMAIDEGTLYPLLRRLESQGLLLSQWREEEKRNKRFYRLSADGKAILKQLLGEWQSINSSLNGML